MGEIFAVDQHPFFGLKGVYIAPRDLRQNLPLAATSTDPLRRQDTPVADGIAHQRHGIVDQTGDNNVTLHTCRHEVAFLIDNFDIGSPREDMQAGMGLTFTSNVPHLARAIAIKDFATKNALNLLTDKGVERAR